PEIAQPLPQLAPLAPISPQLPEQFSTGGTVQPNMALLPGSSSSTSASQSASTPGGGGKSLADCMGFWDRATHMSKAEWKAACVRSMEDDPNETGCRPRVIDPLPSPYARGREGVACRASLPAGRWLHGEPG